MPIESTRALVDDNSTYQEDDSDEWDTDEDVIWAHARQNQAGHSHFYRTFFELAILERPFLAKKMLNRHRTFLYAKGTSKFYLYDLSLLGGVHNTSNALRLIVEHNQRDLVATDLVQWLITAKWGVYGQRFLIKEAATYVLFIILYVLSSLSFYFTSISQGQVVLIDSLLILLSCRYMFSMVAEWRYRGADLKTCVSIFRSEKFTGWLFALIILINILRYGFDVHTSSIANRLCETFAAVLLWVRVLYYAEAQYKIIGLTMSIVRRMMSDISVYVLVGLVFLTGFAHAMTIAFRGSTSDRFADPLSSFTTLGFFMFNLDQDAVFDEEHTARRVIGTFLLAMYEGLVVVIFLNLVIAVMTTSLEDVMNNARTEWLLVRAKFCLRSEDQSTASMLNSGLRTYRKKHTPLKTIVVMEKANGETEVSLPSSMIPSHFLPAWCSRHSHCANQPPSSDKATSPLANHACGGTVVEYGSISSPPSNNEPKPEAGRVSPKRLNQDLVVVGSFVRELPESATSITSDLSSRPATNDRPHTRLSDEGIYDTLKAVVSEFEARRQNGS